MGLWFSSHTPVKYYPPGPRGRNGTRLPVRTVRRVLAPIPDSQAVQSKPFCGDWVVLVQCKKGGFADV